MTRHQLCLGVLLQLLTDDVVVESLCLAVHYSNNGGDDYCGNPAVVPWSPRHTVLLYKHKKWGLHECA